MGAADGNICGKTTAPTDPFFQTLKKMWTALDHSQYLKMDIRALPEFAWLGQLRDRTVSFLLSADRHRVGQRGLPRGRGTDAPRPRCGADMSVDPKVGSMIPEDLTTKCSIGSMIQSDPIVKFDSRSWIPLDPSVPFWIGSWIPADP